MRQINIQTLRAGLKQELDDLPVQIIRSGKVIAWIIKPNSVQNELKTIKTVQNKENPIKKVKAQLVNIVEKKAMCTQPKANIAMGVVQFRPCPKKGKK